MGHNTGNDLNSSDILDFSDNCVNLDTLMNSDEDYWVDRFNNKKPTIDYALRMAGFTPAGFDFTTGGVLKNGDRNKCVFNQADQTWYSWSGDLPYNVIAGSVPGEGWKVVDRNTFKVDNVLSLKSYNFASPTLLDNSPIFVRTLSYYQTSFTAPPKGEALYMLTTLENARTFNNDIAWVPDGWADHYLDIAGGKRYVALLIPTEGFVSVEQCGAKGDYFIDRKQQIVNSSPTDDTQAFQAAAKVSFHIVMSDCGYYVTDNHGPVNLTVLDAGVPRSQYRITGASRMRTGIYYYGTGIFWECQARGGTNSFFEHFRMKNIFNTTDTSDSVIFNETTSVAIKLESATRVTFSDVHIQGFGNGIFAENVSGTWCEFLTLDNCELFRNLINIPLRVNGGTNSFHGLNTKNLIIHTVPNGYGLDIGEGVYLYNSHIEIGFFGTGDSSEVSLIARAGPDGNANIEQVEFAVWSEKGGKVVIEDGAKVDAEGFWHEHLGELVIEDENSSSNKGFLIFEHGKRTWSSIQPTDTVWGADTITTFIPGLAPGRSPIAGLHVVDGVGRSTVLAATDNTKSGHHFAFGTTFENLVSKSYVDSFGGFHPNSKNAARYSYNVSPPTQGAGGHASGSVAGVQTTSRQIDCRPLYAYTSDGGSTPYALAAQMIYSSSSRPSEPITGQAIWYTTTSSPNWYNGAGWVEGTVSASDASLKTAPENISDSECLAALEMKLVKFKMLDSVEEKGVDAARYHYGVIAQQCIGVLEKYGVNVNEFAPLLRAPVFDETGKYVKDIWKVRYHELLILQNEAIRRKIAGLV